MVPLDRALVSSYRLSIVTMSLSSCSALVAICNPHIWGRGQYPCLVGKGTVGMGALDRALVSVYSLLIVAISLIHFGRNASCKFRGSGPYFGRTGVRRGSAMVALDMALVSSYSNQ